MFVYIFKSTAILALLLLFYKLFLEQENMHTFKRFYLLGALALAFLIPYITFIEYVEIPVVTEFTQVAPQLNTEHPVVANTAQAFDLLDYVPYGLWSVYVLGLLFFGYKFIRNLSDIVLKIRKNPKHRIKQITNVLLSQNVAPHTFLRYIFLNKNKFESKQIPQEVLLHEETHAKQKHSIDVLLIEFVQVLFWFNPLIYLLKKAIKLNHEFLADRAVIQKGAQPSTYQQILLEFSSNSKESALANAINYSSIKKRFTVMKKQTSKKSFLLRSTLLIVLLSTLVYSFSQKKILKIQPENNQEIIGTWINKKHDFSRLTISKQKDEYTIYGLYFNPINFQEIDGKYYRTTPKGKWKLPIQFDKEKRILTYQNIEYIPFKSSSIGKLSGSWENKKESIKFTVRSTENEILWDVMKSEGKPVRYYPKKQDDSYAFTYGGELWSFKVENDILHDSKGTKYQRIPETIRQNLETEVEPKIINIKITNSNKIISMGHSVAIEFLHIELQKYNPTLSKEEREESVRSIIRVEKETPQNIITRVETILKGYGVAQIDIVGPNQTSSTEETLNKLLKPNNSLSIDYQEGDSLAFIKDWYITIDGGKFFYLKDKNKLWHYYDSTKKEIKLDIVAEYKKKYNEYSSLKNSGTHYIHKSKNEQSLLNMLFSDLGGMYFRMSRTNKNKVKRSNSPYAPYMKFVKNGKTVFKKENELTEEDKKLIPPPIPNSAKKLNSQVGATSSQIKEYNTLAKKYNRQLRNDKSIQILKSDVDRLEHLHGIMTHEQKENAQPFPDFPEPPPAPEAPVIIKNSHLPPPPPIPADATEEEKTKYKKAIRNYEKGNPGIVTETTNKGKRIKSVRIVEDNEVIPPTPPQAPKVRKGEKSNIPPPPLPVNPNVEVKPTQLVTGSRRLDDNTIYYKTENGTTQYYDRYGTPVDGNGNTINIPPPPPKPPLDHVIEMAKKDAVFYYEGKEVSSDKAIAILKKNKSINVRTKHEGQNKPTVELSTKPIIIKK